YKQADNTALKFNCLYSAINTLGSIATENVMITPGGELYQLLLAFINKAQQNFSMVATDEMHRIFDYLQNTPIKAEQELRWIIGAFIQTVCDVVDEIKHVELITTSHVFHNTRVDHPIHRDVHH
ncbi:MAG: hypothetical protein V4496_00100, partial [Pseudomonadota bacterium]